MTDLYLRMKDQLYAPNLDASWIDLGVQLNEGVVRFDDSAPLAGVREAITLAASTAVQQANM